LGVEDTQLGLLDQATTEFRKAIELDPATATHHANLAYVLIRLKRHGEAEAEAQTAVGLDPTNAKAQFILGLLLARRPETRERSIAHLEYAAREMPVAHDMLQQVRQQP
jgi:Flp pilus assembly protein TadD